MFVFVCCGVSLVFGGQCSVNEDTLLIFFIFGGVPGEQRRAGGVRGRVLVHLR